jgi:rhomboid protease GluP
LTATTDDLLHWGADYGPRSLYGEWWRMFANSFIHLSVIHLAANMVALGYVGRTVERMLGNASFLLTYIAAGVGGSLASLYWNPLLVSAGASGAVFGVYGALLGLLLRQRGTIPQQVFDQLKWFAIVFVCYNALYGVGQSNIDMAAHIGGVVCGFLCGLALGEVTTPATADRRMLHAFMAACAALVILAGTGIWVRGQSRNLPEIASSFDEIVALDEKDATEIKDMAAKVKRGDLQREDLATLLENLLPDWRAAHARLDELAPFPGSMRPRIERVTGYMTRKQTAWEKEITASHEEAAKQSAKKVAAQDLSD